jgi:hypothetical protein
VGACMCLICMVDLHFTSTGEEDYDL